MSAYKYIKLFLDRDGANGTVRGPNLSVENIEDIIAANALTSIPGPYTGDTEAASNGVPLNSLYRLSQVNDYDIKSPEGRTVIMRVVTILLLILSSFATVKAQFITNELIAELDTMQITDPGDFRSPWRYSRSEDQLYRWDYTTLTWEKTPGYYSNHIFLSQDGSNATGKLGRPDKPFLDPWGAQDSLSSETNLSLIVYQGDYSFPVSQFQEMNTADTFFLAAFGGSNFSYSNVTGEPSLTGIITDTPSGVNATKKTAYINAPSSRFSFTDTGIKMLVANYNPLTYTKLIANNVKITGGRSWLAQSASGLDLNIDSVHVDGDILISLTGNYTNAGLDTISQKTNIKIGTATVAGLNAATSTGTIRIQSDDSYIGAIANISINNYIIRGDDGGMLISLTRGEFKSSVFNVNIGNYRQETNSSASAMFEIGSLNSTMFDDAKLLFRVDNSEISQPILDQGFNTGMTLNNGSQLNISIGSSKINYVGSEPIFNLQNIVLNDSSIVRIHCGYCESDNGGQVFFDLTGCDIPNGSILEISGVYVGKGRPGEMVRIGANTDLSGVVLKNAIFINDGTAEWIEASTPTTITGASGLWSNSDSTVNTTIQGNKMWGFNRPIKTEVASNVSCVFGTILPVDVSGGTVEVDLPTGTPSKGNWFIVSDSRANSAANNITVDFITAGDNFQGAAANDVVATNGATVEYIYINSTIGWIRK